MLSAICNPKRVGLALVVCLAAGVPQSAGASDLEFWGLFARKAHFTAELSNAETVPLVPDRGFSGTASAWLSFGRDGVVLKYKIESDMDLNAGFPATEDEADDITKIHLHNAPPGIAGPHVLNVYKLPAQDDDDLLVRPNQGIVMGIWDDEDLSEGLPPGPASVPLSEALAELCDGQVYVNVHGTGDQGTGALRGNLEPTRRGRSVCRFLRLKGDIF